MKRVIIAGFIATLALSFGQASAFPSVTADCTGVTDEAGIGECTTTFELTESSYFVSLLDTFGNFDALLETGNVTLEWLDADGEDVTTITCVAIGRGGANVASVLCTQGETAPSYATGVQTLKVTASSETPNQDFIGSLALSVDGELI